MEETNEIFENCNLIKDDGILDGVKVTKVYVETKKSMNFQTYTVGLEVSLSDELNDLETEIKIKKIQTKCRKLVMEQINLDRGKLSKIEE